MSGIVTNRVQISGLHKSWLLIKVRSAELLMTESIVMDSKDLREMKDDFDADLNELANLTLFSAVSQIYPEVYNSKTNLINGWQGIRSKLDKMLLTIELNSHLLPIGDQSLILNTDRDISNPEVLQFFQNMTRETRWVSSSTETFDRDLEGLINWIDQYTLQQLRAFQVLLYFLGATIIMSTLILIGVSRNMALRQIEEEKMRFLTQSLIKAQEIERRKIALELHDRVAQELSTGKMSCEAFVESELEADQNVREKVVKISKILEGSIKSVRDLAYDLRPVYLDHFGLAHTIFQFCKDFTDRNGISVDFTSAGMDDIKLDFDTEINLYRIIQEALNNVKRHSKANNVIIRLVGSFPKLILRIEDDGKGFDIRKVITTSPDGMRMGIKSIEERVGLLGGNIKLQSLPKKGTKIYIEVPYTNKENGYGTEKKRIDY
jgi:signal transduction histidine kinase